jgi:hypothetical protein
MNCQTYHDLLQEHLDRARPGAPPVEWADTLERHLGDCPNCAALHRTARRLADGLRRIAPPPPPLDLAQRIAHNVLVQRAVPVSRSAVRARRLVAALALAACVLLVLGGLRFFRPGPMPVPPPDDSARAPGPKDDGPSGPPSLRASVVEAGSAVAQLTTRAADEAFDQTRALLPRVPTPSLDVGGAPDLEPPPRGLREAREGVSAGLEPVASSALRAFGMFRRELAPAEANGRSGL